MPYFETSNEIEGGNEQQLASTLGLYAAADLVVSARLHGCILGLGMGCKVLALSCGPELESFMNAAGLGSWVGDIKEIGSLREHLCALADQRTPLAFIENVRRENQNVALKVGWILQKMREARALKP